MANPSLLVCYSHSHIIIVLLYVDDIVIIVFPLFGTLHKLFSMKDLGPLHFFLGIEVSQSQDGMFLSQQKYACDLLVWASMHQCKPISTP